MNLIFLHHIIGNTCPSTVTISFAFWFLRQRHNTILTWIKTKLGQTLLLKTEKTSWHIQYIYKTPLPFQNIVHSSVPTAYNMIGYQDFLLTRERSSEGTDPLSHYLIHRIDFVSALGSAIASWASFAPRELKRKSLHLEHLQCPTHS